ncbi:4709_t:CDS:1, partial [Racocetra persica]
MQKNFCSLSVLFYLINFIKPALSQCTCDDPLKPFANTVTVTSSNGVIIRQQPCTGSSRIGSLSNVDRFTPITDCLGECVEIVNTWLKVQNPSGFIWAGATDYP